MFPKPGQNRLKTREQGCLRRKMTLNKICVHSQSSSFAFRSCVRGVMFYLDGLFVSQSNGVPPDPLLCFAVGAGVLQRPPPGPRSEGMRL